MDNKTVYFVGKSGNTYPFSLYPINVKLPDTGGIYIIVKYENKSYSPLYIGQTDKLVHINLSSNIISCLTYRFYNCICVYSEENVTVRKEIENDLIQLQSPPCNNMS